MLQTQLDWCIDQVVPACPQDMSLPSFKDDETHTHSKRWKGRDVLLKVFFCATRGHINSSKNLLYLFSLEIYRILPVFSFFSVHVFVAQFNRCSEHAVLTVSFKRNSITLWPEGECTACTFNGCHNGLEWKISVFLWPKVQPLCIQGHGILGLWVLAVEFCEHEISSFMCHFFIMLSLSLSFSAFLQWFSLIVLSGLSCSLYVRMCVCAGVRHNMFVFISPMFPQKCMPIRVSYICVWMHGLCVSTWMSLNSAMCVLLVLSHVLDVCFRVDGDTDWTQALEIFCVKPWVWAFDDLVRAGNEEHVL